MIQTTILLLLLLFSLYTNKKDKDILIKFKGNNNLYKQEIEELEDKMLLATQEFAEKLMALNREDERNLTKINTLTILLDKKEALLEKKNLEFSSELKKARQDAVKKSRAVLRGQASEHLAPFVIPNTNPKDYRFMGNPIDYICFEGLSDVLDGEANEIKSVRFIDIKTGKSKLTKSQRKIRDAINTSEKKVTFETINLDALLEEKTNATKTLERPEGSITAT